MKFDSNAVRKVSVLAALLVVAGISARVTQAQANTVYQGKFTLDHSIRWGKAQLPAGEYQFRLETFGSTPLLARVANAKTAVNVAAVPCNIVESGHGPSELILGRRGGQYVVHTMRIEELRETFIFDPKLASRTTRQEAERTDTVTVVYAKN